MLRDSDNTDRCMHQNELKELEPLEVSFENTQFVASNSNQDSFVEFQRTLSLIELNKEAD